MPGHLVSSLHSLKGSCSARDMWIVKALSCVPGACIWPCINIHSARPAGIPRSLQAPHKCLILWIFLWKFWLVCRSIACSSLVVTTVQLWWWPLPFVCYWDCNWEKAMAPHSSSLAWKIPWTEEPGRLQSMGSLRVGHNWATSLSLFTFMHWRRKWKPTPVFLPGESQR